MVRRDEPPVIAHAIDHLPPLLICVQLDNQPSRLPDPGVVTVSERIDKVFGGAGTENRTPV